MILLHTTKDVHTVKKHNIQVIVYNTHTQTHSYIPSSFASPKQNVPKSNPPTIPIFSPNIITILSVPATTTTSQDTISLLYLQLVSWHCLIFVKRNVSPSSWTNKCKETGQYKVLSFINIIVKGYWQPKFLFFISIRLTDRILNFAFSCVQHIQLLRKLIEMLFVRPPF